MLGADPEVLDRIARGLGQCAKGCTSARQSAGKAVQTLQAQWDGADQASFARSWVSADHDLAELSVELSKLSTTLHRNAAEQRKASRADIPDYAGPGGTGGPGNGGPSSGGPGNGGPDWMQHLLRELGFLPGAHDPASLGFYLTGLLGTAGGQLASWMTLVKNGRFLPRGADGRFLSPRSLSFLDRLRAGSGRFPTSSGLSAWERLRGFDKGGSWGAKGWRGAQYGKWSTTGKWVGRAGTVFAGASSAWSEWHADSNLPTDQRIGVSAVKGASTAAGTWAGGEAGAWAGGAIGTAICPGIGTVIGAGLGGLIGGFAGSQLGSWVGDKIKGIGGSIGHGISGGIHKIASWF